HATVGVVVVMVERLGPGVHTTGLGTLRPLGHRHGPGLGSASQHPELDCPGSGIALARLGTLCCVWGLGPRGGRAAHAAVAGAGAASTVGTLPSGRRG